MKYFDSFPTILYRFEVDGKEFGVSVKDIVLNTRIRTEVLSNISLYDEYDIIDGDTPEIIAEKLYGDPNLNWIIMLSNNKYDVYQDFPLSEEELTRFVREKYGEGNEGEIHLLYGEPHYEDEEGNIVNQEIPQSIAITNYEYERKENEKKRRIKILAPAVVDQVVIELQNIFLRKMTLP